MSRCSSLLVLRVCHDAPHAQWTVISWYSGWILGFTMVSFRRDRGARPTYRQSSETPIISRMPAPTRTPCFALILNVLNSFPRSLTRIETPGLEQAGDREPDGNHAEGQRDRFRDEERK